MPNIINISGTCPAQIKAKKLPMSTSVDAVRTLSDLYLFFCVPHPPQCVSVSAHFPPCWHGARDSGTRTESSSSVTPGVLCKSPSCLLPCSRQH
jgi:hypothetical protein